MRNDVPHSSDAHFGARTALPPRTLDDVSLIAASVRGEESALRELYERYGRLVYVQAQRIVGDPHLAEEVVQDAFVRCWRQARTFDPARGTVVAWLIGVTRNAAVDVLRGRQHNARRREVVLDEAASRTFAVMPDIAGRMAVFDALGTLPATQREAVVLAFYGGLSQAEIAATCGIPLGTVKSRIREAMRRLRAHIIATDRDVVTTDIEIERRRRG
jgi:RNA polymerase sigma-70 factor (ECF subfamily)